MSNPWDIPPRATRGDDTEEIIFTAIGRCVTTWEYVEHDIAEMFAVFVGASDAWAADEPAMKAYGTIISYRNRMEMVSSAALAFFAKNAEPELEQRFKNIKKLCDGWANRRNDSAHGIIIGDKANTGYRLYPSLYNAKKWAEKPAYDYTSTQIDAFSKAILDLSKETTQYVKDLRGFGLALLAKHMSQLALPSTPPGSDQTPQQSREPPSEPSRR